MHYWEETLGLEPKSLFVVDRLLSLNLDRFIYAFYEIIKGVNDEIYKLSDIFNFIIRIMIIVIVVIKMAMLW